MKKIISILLSLVMLLGLGTVAFASGLTAEAGFSYEKNALVVSGTAEGDRSNARLTLEIKNPSGTVVYADQTVTVFNSEGSGLIYEFDPIVLHPKNVSGTYTIYVSGNRVGSAAPVTYEFAGADIQLTAIGAVAAAINKKDNTAFNAAIGNEGDTLGIDHAAYAALGEKGQKAVQTIMYGKTYAVPENIDTDEAINTVQSTLLSVRSDFAAALVVGRFNDAADDAALEAWLTAYGTDFATDDPATEIEENKLYPYIADALKENEKLSARLGALTGLLSIEDIRDAVYEQALLTLIENRHFSEGRAIFEAFPDFFGINTDKLGNLDAIEKGEMYAKAKGSYATAEAAGKAVNALIATYGGSSGGSSGSSSGGSSGGGSSSRGGGGFSVAGSAVTQSTQKAEPEFRDVPSGHWAHAAVKTLAEKSIISGDENGSFNPDHQITRAEFIKLVVMAVGADMNAAADDFADVAADAWYKPYTRAARAFGLTEGDEANCFNPNAYITREDMAVMLYRCYKITTDLGYALSFDDGAAVSDYAKAAVGYLSAKQIINGVGNNSFAPKANATRAAAAQMIYNMLQSVG